MGDLHAARQRFFSVQMDEDFADGRSSLLNPRADILLLVVRTLENEAGK